MNLEHFFPGPRYIEILSNIKIGIILNSSGQSLDKQWIFTSNLCPTYLELDAGLTELWPDLDSNWTDPLRDLFLDRPLTQLWHCLDRGWIFCPVPVQPPIGYLYPRMSGFFAVDDGWWYWAGGSWSTNPTLLSPFLCSILRQTCVRQCQAEEAIGSLQGSVLLCWTYCFALLGPWIFIRYSMSYSLFQVFRYSNKWADRLINISKLSGLPRKLMWKVCASASACLH